MKKIGKDGVLPESLISRIYIVKMSVLLDANHIFKAIPITIPTQFITELERTIFAFIWNNNNNKPRIAEIILYSKRILGYITIPDFKLYFRTMEIKTE